MEQMDQHIRQLGLPNRQGTGAHGLEEGEASDISCTQGPGPVARLKAATAPRLVSVHIFL